MQKKNYLLDACALLAYFDDEKGADTVTELLDLAKHRKINLSINAANLIEVYIELEPVEQQGEISFLWIRPQF